MAIRFAAAAVLLPTFVTAKDYSTGCSYYEIRFSERLVLVTWLVIRYCENARPVVFNFRETRYTGRVGRYALERSSSCLCSSFNSFWC